MPAYTSLRLPQPGLRDQRQNKVTWNEERSVSDADFFTVGYSGLDIASFTTKLVSAGVSTVIDVRHSAASIYKPDFAKSRLRSHLDVVGVDYVHRADLGVPRDIRGLAVDQASMDPVWSWYDATVIPGFVGRNLHPFFNMSDHPLALMCLELDPTSCHRHRLSLALESKGLRGYDL